MKVSELAQRTGVSVHRLRRYEEQGLILAERSTAGYREFSQTTVREVIFIAMSRDLGFSLQEVSEMLPNYRTGTLTFDELVERMQSRIAAVDEQIAMQQVVRQKLVSHIAWLKERKREFTERHQAKSSAMWPTSRKAKP